MISKLSSLLIQAIEIYSYMLLIWVIGSWFPQLHNSKFYKFIDKLIEPYARVFRGLVPPIGGFDFSVIIAFMALNILQRIIASCLLAPL